MYRYEEQKSAIFTDEGQRMFLTIHDHVKKCLHVSGAVRMTEALNATSGDGWEQMACVDRMVELNLLREITDEQTPGQYRVFVST